MCALKIKMTMITSWKYEGGLRVNNVGDNLFISTFPNEEDTENLLIQSPYSFDKQFVLTNLFYGKVTDRCSCLQYILCRFFFK